MKFRTSLLLIAGPRGLARGLLGVVEDFVGEIADPTVRVRIVPGLATRGQFKVRDEPPYMELTQTLLSHCV